MVFFFSSQHAARGCKVRRPELRVASSVLAAATELPRQRDHTGVQAELRAHPGRVLERRRDGGKIEVVCFEFLECQ